MYPALYPQNSFKDFLEKIKCNIRFVVLYVLLLTLTALLVAIVCSILLTPQNVYWVRGLQLAAFIIAGITQIQYAHSKLLPNRDDVNSKLYFSILLSILICGVLSTLYFTIDRHTAVMSFASTAAFMLPAFITSAYTSFATVPDKQYQPWFVDLEGDDTVSIYLNSVQLEIQLAQKETDHAETIYNLTLPGQTRFGTLFNRFVCDTNKKEPGCIETANARRKPYGWEFYTEVLGGLRTKHIDPFLSLRENKIKQHSIIIARRTGTSHKKQTRLLAGTEAGE